MRTAPRLRLALIGVGFLVTTVGVAVFLRLGVVNGDLASGSDWIGVAGAVAIMGGFFVVGAILVLHRPGNVIGWLMAGFALSLTVRSALEQVGIWTFHSGAEAQARWSVFVVSVDAVLLEFLAGEVGGHLVTIDQWLERARMSPQPATEALQRAVHTLNGAFAMTEVPVITEIIGPTETYIKSGCLAQVRSLPVKG